MKEKKNKNILTWLNKNFKFLQKEISPEQKDSIRCGCNNMISSSTNLNQLERYFCHYWPLSCENSEEKEQVKIYITWHVFKTAISFSSNGLGISRHIFPDFNRKSRLSTLNRLKVIIFGGFSNPSADSQVTFRQQITWKI